VNPSYSLLVNPPKKEENLKTGFLGTYAKPVIQKKREPRGGKRDLFCTVFINHQIKAKPKI
jgi:hypothetical protein